MSLDLQLNITLYFIGDASLSRAVVKWRQLGGQWCRKSQGQNEGQNILYSTHVVLWLTDLFSEIYQTQVVGSQFKILELIDEHLLHRSGGRDVRRSLLYTSLRLLQSRSIWSPDAAAPKGDTWFSMESSDAWPNRAISNATPNPVARSPWKKQKSKTQTHGSDSGIVSVNLAGVIFFIQNECDWNMRQDLI